MVLGFLVFGSAVLVVSAGPAMACSCVLPDAAAMLNDGFHDGAFLGTYVERDAPLVQPDRDQNFNNTGFRFKVDHWLAGDFEGTDIVVASSDGGASCGFENQIGDYLAVYLFGSEDGVPNGGLCSTVDGKDAIAAIVASSSDGQLPGRKAVESTDQPGGPTDVLDAVDDAIPTAPEVEQDRDPNAGIPLGGDDIGDDASGTAGGDGVTWALVTAGLVVVMLGWVALRTSVARRR